MRTRSVALAILTLLSALLVGGCQKDSEPIVVKRPSEAPPVREATATPGADLSALRLDLQPVAEGFEQPLYVSGLPGADGVLMVLEKTGLARLVDDGQIASAPFLDLTNVVSTSSEQGLLGLAFSPGFQDNGRIYVNYTDSDGATVIARFVARPDRRSVDPGTQEQLLRIDQPYANHNGGNVVMGPDGMLWIGMGDGGSGGDPQGNGQNPRTLLGKMLRIDVGESGAAAAGEPYGIPADNPFANPVSEQDAGEPEIWALGLRNPWRFSFDLDTGDLWIGDVGQNAWEEIDFVPNTGTGPVPAGGLNFGWNTFEGAHPYPPDAAIDADTALFEMPVIEYDRGAGHSVTGGYVYRGSQSPSLLGVYLYGDFDSGRLWAARRNADSSFQTAELLDTDHQIVSFGEGLDGEIYLVDFAGAIYRITGR